MIRPGPALGRFAGGSLELDEMTNPFLSADGAARYAAGRPNVQPLVLERLRPFLKGKALGVDVACGTGQSSMALAESGERGAGLRYLPRKCWPVPNPTSA